MPIDTDLLSTLERSRKELLDLSTRNRLIHTSRSRTRSGRLEVVGEKSADVFRQLVSDRRAMTFDPLPTSADQRKAEPDAAGPQLFQPEDDEPSEEVLGVEGDTALQTSLTSEQLQKRLLKLFYDARTYEEEQGVGILYLAIGFLKWFEDDHSDVERFAPLLLVPVRLDRKSASARFRLSFSENEITTNLSLQARLKNDFGIQLPDVPEADELEPEQYFESVRSAVRSKSRWEVRADDMVLWFFSFAKFLMFRDLGGDNWPDGKELDQRPLIQKLLRNGFGNDPPLGDEEQSVDELITPADLVHVVDADSSQTLVIEEAKRGRNLVIQGPPGTGKSQTIANLICGAVKEGKSVLFVAEKMAALDVVHSRLQRVGLGEMCLELHSSKANKRNVLDQLKKTLELGGPIVGDVAQVCGDLETTRDRLNGHLRLLHTPTGVSRRTPYQLVGELVRLRAQGIAPCPFSFGDSLKWSQRDFETRLHALRDLADHMSQMGEAQTHPWRGVGLDAVLPTDVDRLQAKLPSILERLEQLERHGAALAQLLRVPEPTNAVGLSSVARLAKRLASAPPLDRRSLANPVWKEKRDAVDQLVSAGIRLEEHRGKLAGVVCDAGWEVEVGPARRALAAYGRSWFCFFNASYRQSQALLAGILVGVPPRSLEERLAILDSLITVQKSQKSLADEANSQLGAAAFGTEWKGHNNDWNRLQAVAAWEKESCEAKLDVDFHAVFAALDVVPDVAPSLQCLSRDFKGLLEDLKQLFESVRLNLSEAFGLSDLYAVPWSELRTRLTAWRERPEALSAWVHYFGRARRLAREGFHPIIERLHRGELSAAQAAATAEMAHYEVLMRDIWNRTPELAAFHGAVHEKILEKFKVLDADRIRLAREQVARAHYDRIPKQGSELGAIGIVRREIEKKKKHLSIRQLLAKAGPAVQAMKPVFLMSPISVAQYLEPGLVDFDLLVIDEASQVQPVDALGAAARAKQIVVVGDSKQLPPSRFFSRMLGGDDADETSDEEELNAGDVESVLGLCCARGVPQRMLRWHYRSRHHSLIAVSNREFYDNRLYVFPSPSATGAEQGLSFHYVSDGVFDRGGSATNRIEARVVAQAVMEHARRRPELTLGVGCFSVAQRDAVLDELELLRREDSSVEAFFVNAEEPFFVKNLENIQGDERDVIFISVGYARNVEGYLAMGFGPLAVDGGERRLNVLITRARDCCRVFSSIRADDIDLNRARSRGAQAFKTFLKYAETGLLDAGSSTGKDHDSEFERQVAVALAKHGYKIEPQVGVAGFFIDLAVIDPKQPGRYLLGIECDGATYHRSRSARDRDRLRSAVLESRGWRIHRIWSTDWFNRCDEELRKLLAAVDAATVSATAAAPSQPPAPPVLQATGILREEVVDSPGGGAQERRNVPYVVATFRVSTSEEIHEVSTTELASIVTKVVEIEGPVHEEELARRVSQLWGLQRTGSRIKEAVNSALGTAARNGVLAQDGPFVRLSAQVRAPVRDRSQAELATVRKVEMLPPAEIRQAALAVISAHIGITTAEVVREVADLLGFSSATKAFREVVEEEITKLLDSEQIAEKGENLFACEFKPSRIAR